MNDDLDRHFTSAQASLNAALTDIDIPERPGRRSAWPALAAAACLVTALGFGAVLVTRGSDPVDVLQPADGPTAPNSTLTPTTPATSAAMPAPGDTRQVTNSVADEVTAPVASITQAFNAESSLALLYRTGVDGGEHVVFDTSDWNEVSSPDLQAATDIEDIVWDMTNPDIVRYLDGERQVLVDVNVRTGTSIDRHTFADCDSTGLGSTSGSWAAASSLIAVVCKTADADLWVAYDLETDAEVARVTATGDGAPISLPSGDGFVTVTDEQVIVLDSALTATGVSFDIEVAAFSVATVDGGDALAATVFDGDFVGTVVRLDLQSGDVDVVVGPATGYQYPPSGTTLSTSAASLIAFSSAPDRGTDPSEPLDNLVAVVDLSTGAVTEVGAHGMAEGERFGNWSTPFVSLSPDGRQLILSSDQGQDRVDTFLSTL